MKTLIGFAGYLQVLFEIAEGFKVLFEL